MSKYAEFRGAFAFGFKNYDFSNPYTYKAKYCKLSDNFPGSLSPYPAPNRRYDLQSYIYGHRGVIFQDRLRFPSTI